VTYQEYVPADLDLRVIVVEDEIFTAGDPIRTGGASDLRVTPDGQHVFLEVNPAGEYLFACEQTGQLVPRAISAPRCGSNKAATSGSPTSGSRLISS
jgi:hypothetical protein